MVAAVTLRERRFREPRLAVETRVARLSARHHESPAMNNMPSGYLPRLFAYVLEPLSAFFRNTTSGGLILLAATATAMLLTSLFGEHAVHAFWQQPLSFSLGESMSFGMSLHQWINDGLMVAFFFLIGLELKREILVGELASFRKAILPVMAALGGVLLPAAIYSAVNHGSEYASGWAIPVATDIAFAVGILVLLADRVPRSLLVFLTALAIADDLFAVLIIGAFYSGPIDAQAVAAAGFCLLVLVVLNRGGMRNRIPYLCVGMLLWLAMLKSGIHATLAGVLAAFCIPVRPGMSSEAFEKTLIKLRTELTDEHLDPSPNDPFRNDKIAALCEHVEIAAKNVQTPLQRLEHQLSPWVSFLILPLFAFANAGIDLRAISWSAVFASGATIGIVCALVIGKFAGISLFAWLAVRMKLGRLPEGVTWAQVTGVAWFGGIGFTMSLFISQLAFQDAALVEQSKVGIVLASALSAAIGIVWMLKQGEGDAR